VRIGKLSAIIEEPGLAFKNKENRLSRMSLRLPVWRWLHRDMAMPERAVPNLTPSINSSMPGLLDEREERLHSIVKLPALKARGASRIGMNRN